MATTQISTRTQKRPTVNIHIRNRKTGEHASRTYVTSKKPDAIIRELDRVMLAQEQQNPPQPHNAAEHGQT